MRRKTYPIQLTDLQTIRMPKDANIEGVLSIGNHVALNVLEPNPSAPTSLRYIQMIPKGESGYTHQDATPQLLGVVEILNTSFEIYEAVF